MFSRVFIGFLGFLIAYFLGFSKVFLGFGFALTFLPVFFAMLKGLLIFFLAKANPT